MIPFTRYLYYYIYLISILKLIPRLVASPSDGKVRTQAEIEHNEVLDFKMMSYEVLIILIKIHTLPSRRIRKRYYKTLGTRVTNSQKSIVR